MAKFRGAVLNCVVCGADFRVPPSRAATAKACSNACAVFVRRESIKRKASFKCAQCGKVVEKPRCHANRQTYCSKVCMEASPEIRALKAGRVGPKNPSWKGGQVVRQDRYIYAPTGGPHPFGKANGMVLEHRLVMERHLREHDPDSPFLIEIDGEKYLSPDYEVHHRDLGRTDNRIENLQCMTRADHRALHDEINRVALAYYRKHVILKRGKYHE